MMLPCVTVQSYVVCDLGGCLLSVLCLAAVSLCAVGRLSETSNTAAG